MMIYTIGSGGKTAETFFEALRGARIEHVIDVRLHNRSHLLGFAKVDHLPYLVREIVGADYAHEPLLAPDEDLFDAYRRRKDIDFEAFAKHFIGLLRRRRVVNRMPRRLFDTPTALLCTESTPQKCHRRLVAEYLSKKWTGTGIQHL